MEFGSFDFEVKEIVVKPFCERPIRVLPNEYMHAGDIGNWKKKYFRKYAAKARYKALAAALSELLNIPVDRLAVSIKTGPLGRRGTWIHPKLAVHYAQWVDTKFAVLVCGLLVNWIGSSIEIKEEARVKKYKNTPIPRLLT
jgi:hypothetical protein